MTSTPPKRPARGANAPVAEHRHEDAAAGGAHCDALAVVRDCIESRRASWGRRGIDAGIELPCGPLPWLSLDASALRGMVAGALDSVAKRLRGGGLQVALWREDEPSAGGRFHLEIYADESAAGMSLDIRLDQHPSVPSVAPVEHPDRALLLEEHPARARILQAQCSCLGMEAVPAVAAPAALAVLASAPHRMVWLGGGTADGEVAALAAAIRRTEHRCRFPGARIIALRNAFATNTSPDIDATVDWPLSLDCLRMLGTTAPAPEAGSLEAIRSLFLRECRRDAAVMREAVAVGDWGTVARHAHRIKGGTIVVGESGICEQAERVEQAARRAVPDRALLIKLLSELDVDLRESR